MSDDGEVEGHRARRATKLETIDQFGSLTIAVIEIAISLALATNLS
jgi:hypothetical protein